MNRMADRIGSVVVPTLAILPIASLQALPAAQDTKLQGLITARNGEQMTVRTAAGNVVVTLTDATEVEVKEGKLGLRKKQAAVMGLIPGLKVEVHATPAQGGGVTATSVSFSAKDLEAAEAIQAGLNPTQQQVVATTGKAAANTKAI